MLNDEVKRGGGLKGQDSAHYESFRDDSLEYVRPDAFCFHKHTQGSTGYNQDESYPRCMPTGVTLRWLNRYIIGKHSTGWICPSTRTKLF